MSSKGPIRHAHSWHRRREHVTQLPIHKYTAHGWNRERSSNGRGRCQAWRRCCRRTGYSVRDGQNTAKWRDLLDRPSDSTPQAISLAIAELRASHTRTQSQVQDILLEMAQRSPRMAAWARPKVEDKLYESSIAHADDTLNCDSCNMMGLQIRPPRISEGPIIHYGKIASSNKLIKDANVRDRLSSELGAICFEKEAAGMIGIFPCLVIRGICDYSDSHKNKEWRQYASAVAAAYTVELLSMIPHKISLQGKLCFFNEENPTLNSHPYRARAVSRSKERSLKSATF